jgi:hypothetical protein
VTEAGLIAVRRRPLDPITLGGRGLVVVAVLAILFSVITLGRGASGLGEVARLRPSALAVFVSAAAIYMLGHGLRALRLALLIGNRRLSLRLIAAFHLMTAAVNLIVPLKLGEVYRVAELAHVVKDPIRALILVWWERVFDVGVLFGLLALALAVTPEARVPSFIAIAGASAAFVAATATVALLLPGNLARASFFIIRRYRSPRTVPVLRLLSAARRAIDEAPRILRGKWASLAMLSLLIWACELGAFALMLGDIASVLDGFLAFLSSIIQGQEALCCAAGGKRQAYVVVTHGALSLTGLAAALYYARLRFGGRPRVSDARHAA